MLNAANTYTGVTSVNGGVLQVDGSTVTSPLTTVGAVGRSAGIGSVGATQISANGVFAPGNGTAGHVDDGRGQSRISSGRALSGADQSIDVVVRQRHRHGDPGRRER